MSRPLLIAPSVLACDLGRVAEQVRAVDEAGGDWIHFDVMDGRFVPEVSFGPGVLKAVRRATAKPINVHLMVVEPERSLHAYAEAGADHLIVHAEPASTIHLHRTLGQVRELGKGVGVAINPATPLEWIDYVLPLVDIVLVMTVNPGFGGQAFIPEMLTKIAELKRRRDALDLDFRIEVDGGLDPKTVGGAVQAGADVIVAGTSIFRETDYASAINALRKGADA